MIGPDLGAKMAVWSASDPVRDGELSAGQSAPMIDTLIAATGITRGLTSITRHIRDASLIEALLDHAITGASAALIPPARRPCAGRRNRWLRTRRGSSAHPSIRRIRAKIRWP